MTKNPRKRIFDWAHLARRLCISAATLKKLCAEPGNPYRALVRFDEGQKDDRGNPRPFVWEDEIDAFLAKMPTFEQAS